MVCQCSTFPWKIHDAPIHKVIQLCQGDWVDHLSHLNLQRKQRLQQEGKGGAPDLIHWVARKDGGIVQVVPEWINEVLMRCAVGKPWVSHQSLYRANMPL